MRLWHRLSAGVYHICQVVEIQIELTMSDLASIPSLIGGFVEGISISNILFGITIAQFYVYTQAWDRDPKWLKCLATIIILLEIVYTVFSNRAQYFYSVLAIENPALLFKIDWSVPVCSST
ncbi:hypothetical protein QCA50_013026 [Cerrena zonata]|uniref:Uncharacterized protein n=1 Tax=Cerrena zonata TaxID=2478898 RepID=A0AAW0G3L6_9APHY